MSKVTVGHDWTADQFDWPIQHGDGIVQVNNTNDKWEVGFDVQFFRPDEIEVKVSGSDLLINCRHETREDQHGTVAREIHRAYKLPVDVDTSTLQSHLSSRGVLKINAQKKAA